MVQCAIAHMGNNPFLLVMHANFLVEVRKDGQAARTQMQLAQKANPSLLDNYNIYVVQQLAKGLKRGNRSAFLLAQLTSATQVCCPQLLSLPQVVNYKSECPVLNLGDHADGDGLDLLGYVEFQRNYR
jgi:hypothetical protein